MRILIVTVAGTATRFNKDTDKETLKCIFYEESPKYSILNLLIDTSVDIDKIIIVGGYLFDELLTFVQQNLFEHLDKIEVVFNEYYNTYGSGYSLIKGINAITDADEIIFAEGDLYFDAKSYSKVIHSNKDVITVNREFISSDKSVVLYVNDKDEVKYLYDVNHKFLEIPEPITSIYNSGQVWKFNSADKLRSVVELLTDNQIMGTNLEIIQGYFNDIPFSKLDLISFDEWYNCNTVNDYMNFYNKINK
jgi:NDP-sugar pyrophosphorylase family protein